MPDQLKVTTRNSIWTFDFDSMMVMRMPNVADEGAAQEHPDLSYSRLGSPTEFHWVKPFLGGRKYVLSATRQGETKTTLTGDVIEVEGEIPQHILERADG